MHTWHLQIDRPDVLSDPESIALESLEEKTRHFIFDDALLFSLRDRGLAEPSDGFWRLTKDGRRALSERIA